ncbi:methylamine utilization protein MauE [Pontibacter ummariensis]|uniref:Methylamine utilisation protein MauE n=1 Tax=Pontibacter ummariensis TaxID=1610492 RepID=A0A239IH88_9BACT|nr:MauE/DoxX family redox-associated membrane protein [Pontibacter ummariensis]PRY09804.1 methylamine utilization protein MauE [Pontibacter ummariensis]SNS91784.1 Methylamine utilisation protein MauE [Pontibacter ummariensis]
MNKKNFVIQLISVLLVALWVYAAVSKLQEFNAFHEQLHRQPLPSWTPGFLVWGLPLIELIAAGLLLFQRFRGVGIWLSFLLMLLFTGYVGLAVVGVWDDVPCACGGVISQLGWEGHLLFNLFFTILTGVGVFVWKQKRSGDSGGDAASGEAAYPSGGR